MADEKLLSPQATYRTVVKRSGSGLRRQNFPCVSRPTPLTVPAIYIDRHSGSRGETTANREFSPMSAVSALC